MSKGVGFSPEDVARINKKYAELVRTKSKYVLYVDDKAVLHNNDKNVLVKAKNHWLRVNPGRIYEIREIFE